LAKLDQRQVLKLMRKTLDDTGRGVTLESRLTSTVTASIPGEWVDALTKTLQEMGVNGERQRKALADRETTTKQAVD
jgi:truncated hemoglobin YjbI